LGHFLTIKEAICARYKEEFATIKNCIKFADICTIGTLSRIKLVTLLVKQTNSKLIELGLKQLQPTIEAKVANIFDYLAIDPYSRQELTAIAQQAVCWSLDKGANAAFSGIMGQQRIKQNLDNYDEAFNQLLSKKNIPIPKIPIFIADLQNRDSASSAKGRAGKWQYLMLKKDLEFQELESKQRFESLSWFHNNVVNSLDLAMSTFTPNRVIEARKDGIKVREASCSTGNAMAQRDIFGASKPVPDVVKTYVLPDLGKTGIEQQYRY
jgi:hypothetical protein